MAEAKQRSNWDHTAQLLKMIAEVNNDWKKNPNGFEIHQFHPYRQLSKEDREAAAKAKAYMFHLKQLQNLPDDKIDAAIEAFFAREGKQDVRAGD